MNVLGADCDDDLPTFFSVSLHLVYELVCAFLHFIVLAELLLTD